MTFNSAQLIGSGSDRRSATTDHAACEKGKTMQKYLTVPGAAQYLNTTVRFVRRLIEERRIAFHRFGRHVRLAKADLDEFVAAGRVDATTRQITVRRVA